MDVIDCEPGRMRCIRAAMNPIRLNMLKTIFESGGRDFSVSDSARILRARNFQSHKIPPSRLRNF